MPLGRHRHRRGEQACWQNVEPDNTILSFQAGKFGEHVDISRRSTDRYPRVRDRLDLPNLTRTSGIRIRLGPASTFLQNPDGSYSLNH